jgi:hypothetical protein
VTDLHAPRLAFDQAAPGEDGIIRASGHGIYSLAGPDVQFAFEALQAPGETAPTVSPAAQ